MEESPITRTSALPDLVTTPDPFECDLENLQKKHVIDIIKEFGGLDRLPLMLTQIVADELSKYGIDFEVSTSTRNSRSKSRKSPRISKEQLNGLHRLVEVKLRSSDTKVFVPFVIKETCDFIRRHITDEGILRKSGSSSRAACIMQRFLSPENEEHFSTFDTVHDVANVLKQYLRELEVPLIPHNIHNVFIQCLDLKLDIKTELILLSTCLIPPQTVGILSFVMEFLADVAQVSGDNLMTYENLAIVMGPNIMPFDQRRHEKAKELQQTERHALDLHNKVVEALIVNADSVGRVSSEVEKRLETFISLRSSEDELENDGVGRRKKRRSGSLNRMLGFLKKVTSGKGGGDTPIVPSTPCSDSFSHTPVIRGSSRKKATEDNIFSMHKKKNILDGVRKNGDVKIDASGTPNTLAALIACPSPAVCLNPRVATREMNSFLDSFNNQFVGLGHDHLSFLFIPMRVDYKQTPNGNRLKNFVTPSLLRRRDKMVESDKTVFSAPAKPGKPRLRFGRKGKKQEDILENDTKSQLHKGSRHTSSTISIHKLTNSPRATLQRNPSTKIPRPDKPVVSIRKENSVSTLSAGNTPASNGLITPDGINSSGEYVTLSATAEINDVKNEAFIASSISLTDSEYGSVHLKKANETSSSMMLTDESVLEPPKLGAMDESYETNLDYLNPNKLQLTPLIKEIDSLTRTAQEMTLSTLKGKSASSLRGVRSRTLPESPTELDTTPLNVEQVENKFIRALKETKIVQIRSENTTKTPTNIHRRLSVQDRGMSPSQRRILSSARRRSHEIGRVTPVVNSTQFMSLQSPRSVQQQTTLKYSCSTLKRSPNRCTLKRGRPNTTRVGLARPSPARSNTPRSVLHNRSSFESTSTNNKSQEDQQDMGTPLRRMSSVQELVQKLEKNRTSKHSSKNVSNQDYQEDQRDQHSNSVTLVHPLPDVVMHEQKDSFEPMQTRSMTRHAESVSHSIPDSANDIEPKSKSIATFATNDDEGWVAGHKFGFDRKDLKALKSNSDRDSIHFLKTLRAGKVPATVEYFNKIGKPGMKSPAKSMIPRYTALALHRTESTRSNVHSPIGIFATPDTTQKPRCPVSGNKSGNSTDRISRRLSAVDIRLRHEQLLQNIKKERSTVKRSATTAGSYQNNKRSPIQKRSLDKPQVRPGSGSNRPKRPTTLDLKKTPSPSGRVSRRMSFQRTPTTQTPRIAEEDESLTVSVQRAIDTLLGPGTKRKTSNEKFSKPSPLALTTSPLKTSNVANIHRQPSARNGSIKLSTVPLSEGKPGMMESHVSQPKTHGSMTRTISERGTKATSISSPRATPKIKKALTAQAYDMINSPRNQAHNCPTFTPRRRLPPRLAANSENRNQTPLKATHGENLK